VLANMLCVGAAVGSAAGAIDGAPYTLAMVGHLRVQWTALAGLLTLGAIAAKRWRLAAAAGLAAILALASLAPFVARKSRAVEAPGTGSLSLLIMNVHRGAADMARVNAYVAQQNTDVVVLTEVSAEAVAALAPTLARYPHHELDGSRTVAVLSTRPLTDLGEPCRRGQAVALDVDGWPVTLVAVHLGVGLGSERYAARQEQLAALTSRESKRLLGETCFVAGDFNMTPWCGDYRRVLAALGAVDVRVGHGILPTWPTWCPLLLLPIDSCLVRGDVQVRSVEVGPDMGSDHYPLVVEVLHPK